MTIHDDEFYGDDFQTRVLPAWMPFSLSDLVPMSQNLRDVALGLVELAYPESRPVVNEAYQLAIEYVTALRDFSFEAAVVTADASWQIGRVFEPPPLQKYYFLNLPLYVFSCCPPLKRKIS